MYSPVPNARSAKSMKENDTFHFYSHIHVLVV